MGLMLEGKGVEKGERCIGLECMEKYCCGGWMFEGMGLGML